MNYEVYNRAIIAASESSLENMKLRHDMKNLKTQNEELSKQLNLADVSVSLQEAMEVIDTYLNAGFKEQRTEAHKKRKRFV